MRISDWSSDVCSSDLGRSASARRHRKRCVAGDGLAELRPPRLAPPETLDMRCARRRAFHARPRIGVIDDPAFLAVGRLKEAVVSRRIYASSQERSVGQECVRSCKYRWLPDQYTKT